MVCSLVAALGVWGAEADPDESRKLDFDDASVEGNRAHPELGYILEKPATKFRCDITHLSLEQYEACFAAHLSDLCGVQLIERDRFELVKRVIAIAPGSRAKTLGSAFPFSLELANGTVFLREASEFGDWGQNFALLTEVSPPLVSIDDFYASRSSFALADRAGKRVFVFSRGTDHGTSPAFRKVELPERSHALIGLVGADRYLISTSHELLLMALDGKSGHRVEVPPGAYCVDSHPDSKEEFLLTASAPSGKVYLVSSTGSVKGSFEKEPGFSYQLLPNGLVSSVNLTTGAIRIRDRRGLVLSRAGLGRPLLQFGLLRQGKDADLFFVTPDGLGVLYGDGFEKTFLALDGRYARVVEADNGTLGVVTSSPSKDGAPRLVERRLEFFSLRNTGNKTSKVVEGVCPSAIRLAERALGLQPSLKATIKDGRFLTPRQRKR